MIIYKNVIKLISKVVKLTNEMSDNSRSIKLVSTDAVDVPRGGCRERDAQVARTATVPAVRCSGRLAHAQDLARSARYTFCTGLCHHDTKYYNYIK